MREHFDVPFSAPAAPLITVNVAWDWPGGFSVDVRWKAFGARSEWQSASASAMTREEASSFLATALDALMS